MPIRAIWRPLWWMWALLGLATLVALYRISPDRLHGYGAVITPVAVVVCLLVLRRLWELPPATTMCAGLALTIFSGAWHQIGLGGLPFDRLLIVFVLLQYIFRAPGVAHVPPLRVRNVHLLMCVTALYVLGSAEVAGTLTQEASALSLIDELGLVPFVIFLLAPSVFSGQRERNMLLATLVGLGAYLGLTAIFESLGPHALVVPKYILNVDTELPGERAGGPFQSSVAEGFATYACAIAAAIAFMQWHGQRKRYFAGFVAAVCLSGCFLTLERGVWLGVVVSAVLTAAMTRTGRRWMIPAAVTCAIVLGGALVFSSTLAHKASTRVNDQRSIWDRENQTAAGLRMTQVKPLFGFGWDRYTSNSLEYFRQAEGYPLIGYSLSTYSGPGKTLPLHDTYLAYVVELGLVGTVLWFATLLWGVGEAVFGGVGATASDLRLWKLGLMAISICFLLIGLVNPDQAPFPVLLLWTWAGVAVGPAREGARRPLRTTGAIRSAPA